MSPVIIIMIMFSICLVLVMFGIGHVHISKDSKQNNIELNEELLNWKELIGNISKYIVRNQGF